jgi:hypothetical protein
MRTRLKEQHVKELVGAGPYTREIDELAHKLTDYIHQMGYSVSNCENVRIEAISPRNGAFSIGILRNAKDSATATAPDTRKRAECIAHLAFGTDMSLSHGSYYIQMEIYGYENIGQMDSFLAGFSFSTDHMHVKIHKARAFGVIFSEAFAEEMRQKDGTELVDALRN